MLPPTSCRFGYGNKYKGDVLIYVGEGMYLKRDRQTDRQTDILSAWGNFKLCTKGMQADEGMQRKTGKKNI